MSAILVKKLLYELPQASKYLATTRPFAISAVAHADPTHKVGPWPRTKEERERAAKKYNLIPEDYEPYDEFEAYGDYPKLPEIGAFNRDPYEAFDDPWEMRNHGEPMPMHYDLLLWDRFDPQEKEKPEWKQFPLIWRFVCFIATPSLVAGWLWFSNNNKMYINHPRKQRWVIGNEQLYEFPEHGPSH